MGKQSKAETLSENAAVASAKYVRMGPRKVRRVVDVIRGMKTDEALTVLQFSPWRACDPVSKVLQSAVANAEHNKQLDTELLWISEVYVDEGPSLRRWRPRAQGRAYPVHKRTSHITVVVEERVDEDDEAAVERRRRRRAKKDEQETKAKPADDSDETDEALAAIEEDKAAKAAEKKAKKTAKKAAAKNSDTKTDADTEEKPAKKTAAKKAAAADDEEPESSDEPKASSDATEGESS